MTHAIRLSPLALAAALCSLCTAALAQRAPSESGVVVQEVTVTAQKRAQSAQEVPIAITAVGSDTLERAKIDSIFDLQAVVPALQVTALDPPGQGTSIMLRGLGNSAFNMGFDPAVATFVDGISRSRSGLVAAIDFLDLERVEVLKGPQGTLFGKNTTAGLVHMISRKPDMAGREGSASLSYGSHNTVNVKAGINLPAGKDLAFRVAGSSTKGDGWLTMVPSGEKIHDRNRQAVKLQALWQPSATFSAHLIADYAHIDEKCCTALCLSNDPRTAGTNGPLASAVGSTIINPPNLDALKVEQNRVPKFSGTDNGLSAELNWKLGGGTTLTSLTGWRNYHDAAYKDNDFSGVDVLYARDDLPKISLMSQELRLAGTSALGGGSSLDWQLGGYYSKERIERISSFVWGSQSGKLVPFIAPGVAFDDRYAQDIESKALFGQMSLNLSKAWTVSGGVRYNQDHKSGNLRSNYPVNNGLGLPNSLPLAVVWNYDSAISQSAPTWNLTAQFRPADRLMTYATVSHGYKSGGISMTRDAAGNKLAFAGPTGCPAGGVQSGPLCNFANATSPTFDKETADHMELGLKTDLLNKRVRINAAVWDTRFKGLQTQTLRPDGSFAVKNARDASSKGVEVESSYALGKGWTAQLAVQYSKARFGDNIPATTAGFLAYSNQRLPFSSDWTVGAGMGYETPIAAGMTLALNGFLNYRSEYYNFSELRADLVQPALTTANLRAAVVGKSWDVALWCRNCTDRRQTFSNFAIPFDGTLLGHTTRWAHIGEPRAVGLTASYYFN